MAVQVEAGVYFVQGVGGGPIKIGFSADAPARLAMLNTGSPVPLRLLGVLPTEDRRQERMIHGFLEEYRLHGEWFDNSPDVTEFVAESLAHIGHIEPEEITRLRSEMDREDDEAFLTVEAETVRLKRYLMARQKNRGIELMVAESLREAWQEAAPEVEWTPQTESIVRLIRKHDLDDLEYALVIVARKIQEGTVNQDGWMHYARGILKRLT